MSNKQNIGEGERLVSGLVGLSLAAKGLSHRGLFGLAAAGAGAFLINRAVTGHCNVVEWAGGSSEDSEAAPWNRMLHVRKSVTIGKPREELYEFWRHLENLPRFMKHLEEVTQLDDRRSHWVSMAPAGRRIEWDAEIIEDIKNESISWRSIPGSMLYTDGTVQFADAPGDRGTEIRVDFRYRPPAGVLGAMVAKIMGEEPKQQVSEDLAIFKAIMETGEMPSTEGQSSDRYRKAKGLMVPKPLGPAVPEARQAKVTVR